MTDPVTLIDDLAQINDKDELLAQLRDVHVPDVSPWPAPGWWFLAALLIGFFIAFMLFRKRQRSYAENAWRREALAELSELKEGLSNATDSDRHRVVQEASSLLRRVMMHVRGRSEVAGLTADAWLSELGHHGNAEQLDKSLHPLLTDVPYQTEPNALETSNNVHSLLSWLHKTIDDLPLPSQRVGPNVSGAPS